MSGGGVCPVQITVRRGTQGANPTVGYHFFANFANTSYGTRLISDSNAFIFDGGVQGSFNPDFSFGSITVYPALVSGGITLNITASISSLTSNKILTLNNVSGSYIPNLNIYSPYKLVIMRVFRLITDPFKEVIQSKNP